MLTPEASRMLLMGAAPGPENPFVRDGNKITLRADQFEVTPRWVDGEFAGYFIRYFWKRMLVSIEKLDSDNREMPVNLSNILLHFTLDLEAMGISLPALRKIRDAARRR